MILACNITVFYLNDQEKSSKSKQKLHFHLSGYRGNHRITPHSLGFFNDIIFLYWHKSRTFAR